MDICVSHTYPHQRLVMGSVIKFWIAYDRPLWREQALNGRILMDISWVDPTMDVSPSHQPSGVLAGFF